MAVCADLPLKWQAGSTGEAAELTQTRGERFGYDRRVQRLARVWLPRAICAICMADGRGKSAAIDAVAIDRLLLSMCVLRNLYKLSLPQF